MRQQSGAPCWTGGGEGGLLLAEYQDGPRSGSQKNVFVSACDVKTGKKRNSVYMPAINCVKQLKNNSFDE